MALLIGRVGLGSFPQILQHVAQVILGAGQVLAVLGTSGKSAASFS